MFEFEYILSYDNYITVYNKTLTNKPEFQIVLTVLTLLQTKYCD